MENNGQQKQYSWWHGGTGVGRAYLQRLVFTGPWHETLAEYNYRAQAAAVKSIGRMRFTNWKAL